MKLKTIRANFIVDPKARYSAISQSGALRAFTRKPVYSQNIGEWDKKAGEAFYVGAVRKPRNAAKTLKPIL
jgi:hypothetical protein